MLESLAGLVQQWRGGQVVGPVDRREQPLEALLVVVLEGTFEFAGALSEAHPGAADLLEAAQGGVVAPAQGCIGDMMVGELLPAMGQQPLLGAQAIDVLGPQRLAALERLEALLQRLHQALAGLLGILAVPVGGGIGTLLGLVILDHLATAQAGVVVAPLEARLGVSSSCCHSRIKWRRRPA